MQHAVLYPGVPLQRHLVNAAAICGTTSFDIEIYVIFSVLSEENVPKTSIFCKIRTFLSIFSVFLSGTPGYSVVYHLIIMIIKLMIKIVVQLLSSFLGGRLKIVADNLNIHVG